MFGEENISCSHAEKYCKDCGKKESYNGNNPLSAPVICKYCGGRMTDRITESFMIDFGELYNDSKKQREKIMKISKTKEDESTIKTLESLKEQFEDTDIYHGKTVKLIIDGIIKRMK